MVTTRDRLLNEAEHLFARSSIAGVTTREIVEAAGQRNTSSISYHFGSRQGLLLEILARRGAPVDEERGRLRSELGDEPPTRALVACLVRPHSDLLGTPEGRSYLRIVSQLSGRFASWRIDSDVATTKHLIQILDELEMRPKLSGPLRSARLIALIMVMTATAAERARRIDEDVDVDLSHEQFVTNLVDMCASLLDDHNS